VNGYDAAFVARHRGKKWPGLTKKAVFGCQGGFMGKFWAGVVVWWQGKKTIVGGGLVMAAAVAGVAYGKLGVVDGLTLLGVGLSIAGFSAKANRHQAELLTAVQGIAQIGVDVRTGNSNQTAAVVEQVMQQIYSEARQAPQVPAK
jgi:hypothetical protein